MNKFTEENNTFYTKEWTSNKNAIMRSDSIDVFNHEASLYQRSRIIVTM